MAAHFCISFGIFSEDAKSLTVPDGMYPQGQSTFPADIP